MTVDDRMKDLISKLTPVISSHTVSCVSHFVKLTAAPSLMKSEVHPCMSRTSCLRRPWWSAIQPKTNVSLCVCLSRLAFLSVTVPKMFWEQRERYPKDPCLFLKIVPPSCTCGQEFSFLRRIPAPDWCAHHHPSKDRWSDQRLLQGFCRGQMKCLKQWFG